MAITNIQRNYNEDEELYISAQIETSKIIIKLKPLDVKANRNTNLWL